LHGGNNGQHICGTSQPQESHTGSNVLTAVMRSPPTTNKSRYVTHFARAHTRSTVWSCLRSCWLTTLVVLGARCRWPGQHVGPMTSSYYDFTTPVPNSRGMIKTLQSFSSEAFEPKLTNTGTMRMWRVDQLCSGKQPWCHSTIDHNHWGGIVCMRIRVLSYSTTGIPCNCKQGRIMSNDVYSVGKVRWHSIAWRKRLASLNR
jgi:hypothetical protein